MGFHLIYTIYSSLSLFHFCDWQQTKINYIDQFYRYEKLKELEGKIEILGVNLQLRSTLKGDCWPTLTKLIDY